jgi:protein O-GlcNAc transferase
MEESRLSSDYFGKTNSIARLLKAAVSLHQKGDLKAALKYYEMVLASDAKQPDALHLRGVIFLQQHDYLRAKAEICAAISIDPKQISYYLNLGVVYHALEKFDDEYQTYRTALATASAEEKKFILNELLKTQRECADWSDLEQNILSLSQEIAKALQNNSTMPISPYHSLTLPLPAWVQKEIAVRYAKNIFPRENFSLQKNAKTKENDRIRLAYLSADFRNHPTGHLMSSWLRYHNREEFSVTVYMYGPTDNSSWQKEIAESVENFVIFPTETKAEIIAKHIADNEIEVLCDVMGYIQNARPEILALRPAPVQINFLAYPGTSGATWIDYILGDEIAIPAAAEQNFSEKILRMPDSYFWFDGKINPPKPLQRADLGLPGDKIILASFNSISKLDPSVFALWLEILHEIPEAILWLYVERESAKQRLLETAAKEGIAAGRIYFAARTEKEKHLARLQAADLLLDSFWVGAHTTALDALFVGSPIVSLMGETMIQRATASILSAAFLDEAVCISRIDYKNWVIKFCRDENFRAKISNKAKAARLQSPVFAAETQVAQWENLLRKISR